MQQMLIVAAVVAGRLFDRNRLGRISRQVKAEAKGLNASVGLAGRARERVVVLESHVDLAGVRLVEGAAAFAAHAIGNAGERGEISFVGGVDEGLGPILVLGAWLVQVFGRDADERRGRAKPFWRGAVDTLSAFGVTFALVSPGHARM